MGKKSANKKISFFAPELTAGGAEKVFVNLANYISRKEYNVDLILPRKRGCYLERVSDDVNIIDLDSPRALKSLFPLVRYLRKEEPDVLISTLNHLNIIAIVARMISKSPTKLIIREGNYFSSSTKRGMKILCRLFYRRVDKVIALTEKMATNLAEKAGVKEQKISIIGNPVDRELILKKAKEDVDHSFLKKKNNEIVLGVGRLTEQKDFSTLIKAFNELKQKKESARLIILGEGAQREKLENLIEKLNLKNKVSLPGFVSNPYPYIKKADVFALSSRWEGLPNVLIEAIALGTPVVSTNCPSGPKKILKNEKYGKLVPVGDVDALAKAIKETLNNPMDHEKLTDRAKVFSTERIGEQYLKRIEELLSEA